MLAAFIGAGLVLLAFAYWFARRPAKTRSVIPDRSGDELEILSKELANLVDVARFINNGFQDDDFYSIRSKYFVIATRLREHPAYSRYVDPKLGTVAEAGHALPLSMLRPEDKERLLVSLREMQGCVQILIDLRDAGCLPGSAPEAGPDRHPPPGAATTRPLPRRGLRLATAAVAIALLAGGVGHVALGDAAGSGATLLAQAHRSLRDAVGLGSGIGAAAGLPADPGARPHRIAAEMGALDQDVARHRDELDGLVRATSALRAQAVEQREGLAAARTEAEAGRAALVALRAEIVEQAGRMAEARAEGEAAIRQIRDRVAALGQAAQDNHAAIDRIAGIADVLQETARGIEEARSQLSRERVHLAALTSDGSDADHTLSEIRARIAALKVSLAGADGAAPVAGTAPATAAPPPPRSEAALQPEEWRQIQQALARSGHFAGKADGRAGEGTRAAVARYQRGLGAEPTGRLTPAQIDRLLPSRPVKGPVAAEVPMASKGSIAAR
ncbi:peptidoglycan-binding domain-containing protein [Methylobacterium sp. 174MFSha1.1]|uniref:peptidoglycan-binding domain-containing protein n=1 Tax=Methylobacterium sp. 174MFSha1.1 TaxID=1502749 RepID=UPI001160677F|nr:peptidoglycan-binding domain-containing protein [Methylobacterium sp. 174MFSha1.1]